MDGQLEYLASKITDIANDVKELKKLQMEQMRSDIEDHAILKEHQRRSTQLEARVAPLEADLIGRARLHKVFLGSSGLLAAAATLVAIWSRLH